MPSPVSKSNFPCREKKVDNDGHATGAPETTLEQWTVAGRALCDHADGLSWQLADWAAIAETFDGETPANAVQKTTNALRQFCESHGLNYGSCRVAARVARTFPAEKRFSGVHYSKHAVIAAFKLTETQRLRWLEMCARENLSFSEIRARIRASLGSEDAKLADGPVFTFATKHALDLQSFLTEQPHEFWTPGTRDYWRKQLKPLVEFYEGLA
jgi:hypothetical protein